VLGRRDLEALHPPGQGSLVVGLDQQMDVRSLEAELDDAKVFAARSGQRGLADRLVHAAPAQIADSADHPQRDMHRVPCVQERPLPVRRARPRALRRTTGPAPLATARLEQHQLLGPGAPLRAGGVSLVDLHISHVDPDRDSVN
jgi:hypothetical protein